MSGDCKQIQDQMAGYVDKEIEPARADTISRHLHDCPGCAREADTQKHVKKLVAEHAKNVIAPPYLRARIRRTLDRHASGFGFWTELRQLFQLQPLPALATAVVLMLLPAFATFYAVRSSDEGLSGGAKIVEGRLEGEMICVDCTLLDLIPVDYTHDSTHRIGLRCKDGKIWSILQSEKGRELIRNPGVFHRRVRVEGHLFPPTHHVEVREFSLI
jgi:anti-sigma factor (TIGR02949 family)